MKATTKKTALNDVAKRAIRDRLVKAMSVKAMSEEKMNTADAAKAIGVKQYYVSAIRSESSWSKCSLAAWEKARRWINLGMSLKKHGERMKMDKMVNEAFDKKENESKLIKNRIR